MWCMQKPSFFASIHTSMLYEAPYEAGWGCAEARYKHERLYEAVPRYVRSIRI